MKRFIAETLHGYFVDDDTDGKLMKLLDKLEVLHAAHPEWATLTDARRQQLELIALFDDEEITEFSAAS